MYQLVRFMHPYHGSSYSENKGTAGWPCVSEFMGLEPLLKHIWPPPRSYSSCYNNFRQNTAFEIKSSMCLSTWSCVSNSCRHEGPMKCWGCEEEEVFTSLVPHCRAMGLSLCCNTWTLQQPALPLQRANDRISALWCPVGPDLGQLCWCRKSSPSSLVTGRQR